MSVASYLRFTEAEIARRNRCGECGMQFSSPAEFHPHLYCILFTAGYHDPAAYLAANGWTRKDAAA